MTGSFRHGTIAGYEQHKCRCDQCRKHHNDRVRRNRADRLARVDTLTHGRRSTYDAGCRCTECKQSRSAALRGDAITRRVRLYGEAS